MKIAQILFARLISGLGGINSQPAELIKEEKLEALIKEEVVKACAEYARYEIPKQFVFVPEPFTPENGILTQTMKLKRREVMNRFGAQMDALYGAERT